MESVAQFAIKYMSANLKKQMGTGLCPTHLLKFDHALAHDLIDNRFDKPWANYPTDLAHSVVLADKKCNSNKRDRLPHIQDLARWSERNARFGDDITAAVRMRIPCDLAAATK